MSKKFVRLTEGDLHRIIKESVKRVLKEENSPWENHENSQYNVDGDKYTKSGVAQGETNKIRDYVNGASQIYEQLKKYINAMNVSRNFTQGYAQLGSYLSALNTYINYNMQGR